jgi:hypothetical protein
VNNCAALSLNEKAPARNLDRKTLPIFAKNGEGNCRPGGVPFTAKTPGMQRFLSCFS